MSILEFTAAEFAEWGVMQNQIGNAFRGRGRTSQTAKSKPTLTVILKKESQIMGRRE